MFSAAVFIDLPQMQNLLQMQKNSQIIPELTRNFVFCSCSVFKPMHLHNTSFVYNTNMCIFIRVDTEVCTENAVHNIFYHDYVCCIIIIT